MFRNYQETYEEFQMPAGTGQSELEAALDGFTEDNRYEVTSKGRIVFNRLAEGEDEFSEDLIQTLDSYILNMTSKTVAPIAGGIQQLGALAEKLLSGNKNRYVVSEDGTGHPYILSYRETDQERNIRIERHDTPAFGKDLDLDREFTEDIRREIEKLAP